MTGYCKSDFANEGSVSLTSPPPYTEQPPPYSTVAPPGAHDYQNSQTAVYMGQPTAPSKVSSATPAVQHYPNQHVNPPMINHQASHHSVVIQQSSRPPVIISSGSIPTAPPAALLQPTPSRLIQTTFTGHRKKESHVTDFDTGKEYIIREKTSRFGRRTKTIIQEVGGPKTFVKETARRTIVRIKK